MPSLTGAGDFLFSNGHNNIMGKTKEAVNETEFDDELGAPTNAEGQTLTAEELQEQNAPQFIEFKDHKGNNFKAKIALIEVPQRLARAHDFAQIALLKRSGFTDADIENMENIPNEDERFRAAGQLRMTDPDLAKVEVEIAHAAFLGWNAGPVPSIGDLGKGGAAAGYVSEVIAKWRPIAPPSAGETSKTPTASTTAPSS